MQAEGGLDRLADLAVRVGANFAEGQVLHVQAFVENATCHIAYGETVIANVPGGNELARRTDGNLNRSATHIDFMTGGPQVGVDGLTAEGETVPVSATTSGS